MHTFSATLRFATIFIFALSIGGVSVLAQKASTTDNYSESVTSTRRRTTNKPDATPAEILRSARTIYIRPNEYIDAEYLEYKLDKLPEFQQWNLAITKDYTKANLVLNVHRKALNYIFSIVESQSGIVVVKGKVVAINDLVAAEDISHEIIKRMRNVRARPTG